ncbi:MAG: minichromosome maintenance protein MCM [Candidatus Diapherotrites archaeon]
MELETQAENPFVEKFDNFFKSTKYKKEIAKLVESYPQKSSISVDFTDLEHYDFQLADELVENPDYVLKAAHQAVKNVDVPALEIENFEPHIRFFNLPKDRQPLIRDISAEHLNKLICVEGIVRQFNEVQPKLKLGTWQCTRCGNTYKVEQEGYEAKQPTMCECKHRVFKLLEDQSIFVNFQKIGVQEPLEQLKGGQQATSVDIHVTDDLVNMVSPGEKTVIVGILRLYPAKEKKVVYGRYLEAISLEEKEKEFAEVDVSKEEEAEIRKWSQRKDIYEVLTNSLAPSIYGHELVKQAIVLQLFSGVKKTLPGNMKVRGNIHVLLVGEPGVAKSKLLEAVHEIAPKSIYVAGKTTSGVGLTASAEKDDFGEGGWTLKAGALVLASGGLGLIDEFDKMDSEDRSAMHEALEQGQVSIAKAGMVTTFRTDTSVLAAANPKFGRFDSHTSPLEQIDLPPTLLSRFDLYFMIKDVLDRKKDEEVASFILKKHQLGEKSLQAGERMASLTKAEAAELVPAELLKKYISYARQKVFPALTDAAMKEILDFYVNWRDEGRKEGKYTATHRQLEALVRLAEASARIRLSDVVEPQDTKRSIDILKRSLSEVAIDQSTGTFDIDIVSTGQSSSKAHAKVVILKTLKDMSNEGKEEVAFQDLLLELLQNGIDQDKAEEMIKELKKAGEIYETRYGMLKPTSRGTR